MKQPTEITQWIEYFCNIFLPSITQKDAETVYEILHWEHEKKAGFLLAKRLFEDRKDKF